MMAVTVAARIDLRRIFGWVGGDSDQKHAQGYISESFVLPSSAKAVRLRRWCEVLRNEAELADSVFRCSDPAPCWPRPPAEAKLWGEDDGSLFPRVS